VLGIARASGISSETLCEYEQNYDNVGDDSCSGGKNVEKNVKKKVEITVVSSSFYENIVHKWRVCI
jgi:hypothetical protein